MGLVLPLSGGSQLAHSPSWLLSIDPSRIVLVSIDFEVSSTILIYSFFIF